MPTWLSLLYKTTIHVELKFSFGVRRSSVESRRVYRVWVGCDLRLSPLLFDPYVEWLMLPWTIGRLSLASDLRRLRRFIGRCVSRTRKGSDS